MRILHLAMRILRWEMRRANSSCSLVSDLLFGGRSSEQVDRRSARQAQKCNISRNTHSILSIRLDLLGAGYTKHGLAHLTMASLGLARGELALQRSTNKRTILSWIRRFIWAPPTVLSVRFRQSTGTCSEGVFDPGLREPQCGRHVIFLVTDKIHTQAGLP